MTEEADNFDGFGVFDINNGFCKGSYTNQDEADEYCNTLNS